MPGDAELGAALHDALIAWSASPGRRDTVRSVVAAAQQLPELRSYAEAIARSGGRSAEWGAIAGADPHGSWLSIASLVESAATKLQLVLGGQLGSVGSPSTVAWSLDRARVTWRDNCLAVGSAPPSTMQHHRYIEDLGVNNVGGALSWFDTPTPTHVPRSVGIVADRHHFTNYFHWLTGALRAAIAFDDCGQLAELDRLIICMPGNPPTFVNESLDDLGLRSVVEVRSTPFDYTFDRVIIPTPVQIELSLPLDEYAHRLRRRLDPDRAWQQGRRRLLISRRDARSRRVVNERDVEQSLAHLGFETITPGQLTFGQQVEAFRSAEIVVAPHGAALANLLFCSPGTRVLEFRHTRDGRPWFEIVARHTGLTYKALSCPNAPDSPQNLFVEVEKSVRDVDALLKMD